MSCREGSCDTRASRGGDSQPTHVTGHSALTVTPLQFSAFLSSGPCRVLADPLSRSRLWFEAALQPLLPHPATVAFFAFSQGGRAWGLSASLQVRKVWL